jgi:hypothetical protein
METVKNEVATKATNAVSTEGAEWGDHEVSANDLIVPQILMMQGLSQFVVDEKAAIGEFRNSMTAEKLGKYGTEPLEVIPFYCQEVFSIQKQQEDGSFKYHRTEPIVKSPMKAGYNDDLPWDDTEMIEGKKTPIKRVRRYNFFVLLPSELDNPEVTAMPYFISFKSTSVKEGKKLFNLMYVRNKGAGLPPAAFLFKVDGRKEKNEKGTFIIPTVEQGERTKPEHLAAALKWFKLISKGGAKTHEEGEDTVAATGSTASSSTGDY